MTLVDRKERDIAASRLDESLVVTAGAGTGKTSLLVERVLHHVLERGTPLDRVAAITFTKKAAAELRERVEDSLERVLQPGPGDAASKAKEDEATRVLARLGRDDRARKQIVTRARAALEALDAAALGTVHSFAAALLRRHPVEAGVDPLFVEDEGEHAREIFEELWPKRLDAVLGGTAAPEGWRGLLAKLAPGQVQKLAWALVGLKVPLDALGDSAAQGQLAAAGQLARAVKATAARVRNAIAGARDTNSRLQRVLEGLDAAAEAVSRAKALPIDIGPFRVPDSCKVGASANVAGKKELEDAMEAAFATIKALAASDSGLARDAGLALRPFVEEFRCEHARRGFVSLDGLLVLARDLLRDSPAVRREEAARFDHILVDEMQDTDPVQYEILFSLGAEPRSTGAAGKLFVVGDAKQSIYRFRGADITAFKAATRKIEQGGGRVLTLSTNFRSVRGIIEPLNDLFASTFPPEAGRFDPEFSPLAAVCEQGNNGGPPIEIWSIGGVDASADERRGAEAAAIATWLRGVIDSGQLKARDAAILVRSRNGLEFYLRALRKLDVPFVIEGGKGFYRRYEVELLLMLLRAVANPGDAVALVSCLRSPICGVPDAELALHASRARETAGGALWSLRAEPAGKQFPRLAQGLELIRDLARRHTGDSIDRLARAALEETPLKLAVAAMYDGAQRVLNLEKLVRRLAEVCSDGRVSWEDALAWIEERDALDVAEGDSPIADESLNAVRVLTIHSAKGLEWKVVILPDLAQGRNPGNSKDVAVEVWSAPSPLLAISAGDKKTPAWHAWRDEEDQHDEAERKRLLYVAATRACERLILVAGAAKKGRAPWIDALGAWGYSTDGGFPAVESVAGGRVKHIRIERPDLGKAGAGAEEPDAALIEAARAHEKAAAAAKSAAHPLLKAPSSLRQEIESAEEGRGEERSVAMAAGTAVHLLLELWDRKDEGWLAENADRAARVASAMADVSQDAVASRVREIIEHARKSGRLAEVARLPSLARELPLLYSDPEGRVWDGTIDLVSGSPEAPVVVDFKTDAGASDEALKGRYEDQLGVYAKALRGALSLAKAPDTRLVSL